LVRPNLAAYYDVYRKVAREEDVGLIDNFAVWTARADLAADIPDGIHPTPNAARAVIAPTAAMVLCPN
jgi:lysophospholipase L1-like esterase